MFEVSYEALNSIQLFVLDIDGCILPRGNRSVDLSVISRIQMNNQQSQKDTRYSPITLCSGRPSPYVELFTKITNGYTPALFEWGGGVYVPHNSSSAFNPLFTEEKSEIKEALEQLIKQELVHSSHARIQPGKEITITVYPSEGLSVQTLSSKIESLLIEADFLTHFNMNCTTTCVDLLPVGLDKTVGIHWLADLLELKPENMMGIGDSRADVGFLSMMGFSACPQNAVPEVKSVVDYISPYENEGGVIDVLEKWQSKLIP